MGKVRAIPLGGYIPATCFSLTKKYNRPTTKQICSWKHFPEGYFPKQKQPSKVAAFHFDTLTELFYLLSFCTTSPPDSARKAPISRASRRIRWSLQTPRRRARRDDMRRGLSFPAVLPFNQSWSSTFLDRRSQLGLYIFLHRCCLDRWVLASSLLT